MTKDKINILYFMGDLAGGGTETHLLRLVTHLDKDRYTPVVVCLSSGGLYMELIQKLNIKCYVLNWVRIYHFSTITSLIKLYKIILKHKIDIIQTFHHRPFIFATIVRMFIKTPVLIDGQRETRGINPRHLPFVNWCNRFVDLIISNSNVARAFRIEEQNIDSKKIITIYNGVEYQTLNDNKHDVNLLKKEFGINSESIVLGVVSRIDRLKGHRFLFDAMPDILKHFPGIKLLVIGKDESNNKIKEYSQKVGITDNVIFTGFRKDILNLLQLIDIMILPSESESFPNVIIEALAAQKAIIATDVGGVKEAIINETTGLLIPPGSPKAITEAVLKLLNNPSLRNKIEKNILEFVKKHFDLNDMVAKTEDIYNKLIILKKADKCKRIKWFAMASYFTGLI